MSDKKELEKKRKKPVSVYGKWRSLALLLLSITLLFADQPGVISAGVEAVEPSSALLLEQQEFSYPTGDLIYDVQKVSEEEVSDDVPVYGNFAVFSRVRASETRLATEDRYGYQSLSENQKVFYTNCLKGITDFLQDTYKTENFSSTENKKLFGVNFLSCNLTPSEAGAAYYCLRDDYPEFFWLLSGYSYTNENLYVMLSKEYYSAEKRVATENAIQAGIKEYVAAVRGITDSYEIVRTIHDKLIKDVDYARKSNGQPQDALWAHSVAGVFDGNKAVVCEGYAKTLQYVLNELGIENIYMTGRADGGAHAWNGVKVNGEWLYIDATWDDAGDSAVKDIGLLYSYFLIPASLFTKSHKVNTPSEIPAMSESSEYTFYAKYSCDFTKIKSVDEARTQLVAAGKSVPGQYIYALVTANTQGYLSQANGGLGVGIKTPDGNSVFFIDATKYKVKFPAVKIQLSETEMEIDRDESKTAVLTAVLTAASGTCDDVVRWSSSSNCVNITPGADGKSATLTARRNGTAVITATAASGGVSATCTVTVVGTAEYENIYMDADFSVLPAEEDFVVWVNGGNVKTAENTKYNYKVRSFYTDIKASKITTVDSKGKTKTKNGKLVAGITLSSEEPTLVKGKIVDSEAAKIAKATVNAKTGLIKVTAQKQTGEVYLWVIDTGDEQAVAYAKISVTAAPTKILLNDKELEDAERKPVKKQTLALGESTEVFLEPLLASKGTEIAQGGTYSVTFSKNGENYVDVEPIEGDQYGYQITPIALDAAKPGRTLTVRVNFVCNENNKKTSISIIITNPITSIEFSAGTNLTMAAEDAFTVKYSETQAQELTLNFTALAVDSLSTTTDKAKLSAVSGMDGVSINEKEKLVVSKPTGDAAKMKASFSKDKNSIVIKVPKKLAVGTKSYFVLYYNKDCFRIYSVEVVE